MFSDPLSLDFAGQAISMTRIGTNPNGSQYRGKTSDGASTFLMKIEHTFGSGSQERNRGVLRLEREWLINNPLVTDQKLPSTAAVTVTVDTPRIAVATDAYYQALMAIVFLASGSPAYQTLNRLIAGEV
jgi:hypothetical protein